MISIPISTTIIQCAAAGILFAISGFLVNAGLTPPADERLLGIAFALFGMALVIGLHP